MGLWLLPVYGVLTLLATLTHQPDPATRFESWSRYVTTGTFLVSHIAGSILGTAVGILGIGALAVALAGTRRSGMAAAGLVTGVTGSVLITAVFGVAAAAQPALGRAFLAGDTGAQNLYEDVYGPATLGIAVGGTLLYGLGFVLLGWSAAVSGRFPRWAGVAFALAGPLIGILGVIYGFTQTVGSLLLITAGVVFARSAVQPGAGTATG